MAIESKIEDLLSPDPGNVTCGFDCKKAMATWHVMDVTVTENLCQPMQAHVTLQSASDDADGTEMLGAPCTISFQRPGHAPNRYHGVVRRVDDRLGTEGGTEIAIEVVSSMALLKKVRRSRVFQNKTSLDIVHQLLTKGLAQYNFKMDPPETKRTFAKHEYRIQYNESDYHFCQRLLEEEGLVYWFDQSETHEVFRVDDAPSDRQKALADAAPSLRLVRFDQAETEGILTLRRTSKVRSGKVALRGRDFEKPVVPIDKDHAAKDHADVKGATVGPVREDYQHELVPKDPKEAEYQARIRQELRARDAALLTGSSTALAFRAGQAFVLEAAPRGLLRLNNQFYLTGIVHSFGGDGGAGEYSNSFSCLPADIPFRPDRSVEKPRVHSLLTAEVVGPGNQETHTEKHGRIRIQFHWDREGPNNDQSSCFIRVVQPWAGAGWGHVFLPRIGMEVVVSFLYGDPDHPVVTGTLFNGKNVTPYVLPDHMTKSTIRTQSTPGGKGYNELSFEDAAGNEEVYLRAQKNLREETLNNHKADVGVDETLTVGQHQQETIGVNQTLSVGQDQGITVGQHRTSAVGANDTETVGQNQTTTVGKNQVLTVKGNRAETVVKASAETVMLAKALSVGLGYQVTVGGAKNETVTLSSSSQVGINHDVRVGKVSTLTVGDELRIQVGDSSITLKKNGEIVIAGKKVEINGSSNLTLNGQRVDVN